MSAQKNPLTLLKLWPSYRISTFTAPHDGSIVRIQNFTSLHSLSTEDTGPLGIQKTTTFEEV